jgi:hypothetical protein
METDAQYKARLLAAASHLPPRHGDGCGCLVCPEPVITSAELANVLYSTFAESRGWQDADGHSMNPWNNVREVDRAHWSAVAREALTRCKGMKSVTLGGAL